MFDFLFQKLKLLKEIDIFDVKAKNLENLRT